jgi:hypothetical protein
MKAVDDIHENGFFIAKHSKDNSTKINSFLYSKRF